MATSLHKASYKDHIDAMKLLIEHEANVDEKDNDGCTSLYIASYNIIIMQCNYLKNTNPLNN